MSHSVSVQLMIRFRLTQYCLLVRGPRTVTSSLGLGLRQRSVCSAVRTPARVQQTFRNFKVCAVIVSLLRYKKNDNFRYRWRFVVILSRNEYLPVLVTVVFMEFRVTVCLG